MTFRPHVAVCFLLLACPGCGLLVLPTIEAFPSPVQKVTVRDARTGAPIPSASVEFQVISVSTKANLFQTWGTSPSEPEGEPVRLAVKTEQQGSFIPVVAVRLAFWHCLFPLFSWSTPGDWWYYGHKTRICIRAPGYNSVRVDYPAWPIRTALEGDGYSFEHSALTVRLSA
jgi:hypothetical protein